MTLIKVKVVKNSNCLKVILKCVSINDTNNDTYCVTTKTMS